MKKFLALFFCILGAAAIPAAARYFNYRYTLNSGGNVLTNALYQNNKIYAVSYCTDSINYLGSGMFKNKAGWKFVVMDSLGNVLHTTLHQRDDKIYSYYCVSNNMVPYKDSFIIAFSMLDTAIDVNSPDYLSYHTAIAVCDTLGNLGTYKEFERPVFRTGEVTNFNLYDFKADAYGNRIMLASVVSFGQVVCYVHKLDKDFNTIWIKTLKTGVYHNNPKHLLIEDDGYVITGGINNANFSFFPNYYTSLLIKCDTAGNILWDWKNRFDTDSLQYTINDIIRTKDRAYVYCGSGFGKPTFYDGKSDWSDISVFGLVEKLDSNRNSVWKTKLSAVPGNVSATEQVVVKELSGGDIMVAGTVGESFDPDDATKGWIRGSLARLDGNDGHIIWQRFFKSPDGNDTMILKFNDMRPTPDGGYLLAGEARNYIDRGLGPVQQGWLVRVDSAGCLGPGDPQCKPLAIHEEQTRQLTVHVYPNPASNILFVSNNSTHKVLICISDLTGNTIITRSTPNNTTLPVDITQLTQAMYIYHIYDKNGMRLQSGKFIKQ